MGRQDISVIAKHAINGKVTPLQILWEDGRVFDIDKITDMRKCASLKAGGIGVRYICNVRNKEVLLFKDEDKWFIEN